MQYWLLKSEPDEWSWMEQVAIGDFGEPWTGVRNYQARNYMQQMRFGDLGFFYHSGKVRSVVGIVEVIKVYEPDPTDTTGKFGMVTVKARCSLTPVSLFWIKEHPMLQRMKLNKQPRLSVQPVTKEEWDIIVEKGNITE